MPEQTVLQTLLDKFNMVMMSSGDGDDKEGGEGGNDYHDTNTNNSLLSTDDGGDYAERCLHSFRPSKGSSIYKVASALLSCLQMVTMEMIDPDAHDYDDHDGDDCEGDDDFDLPYQAVEITPMILISDQVAAAVDGEDISTRGPISRAS